MPEKFESTLQDITLLTPTVKSLFFSVPSSFVFKGGQFVISSIYLPDGKKIKRSYSIASAPYLTDKIELCIKLVEGGPGSTHYFSMKKGDTIEFFGPFGHFYCVPKGKPLVFIATGTGLSPLRSMIQDLLHSGYKETITLLTGFRYESEILYADEWKELKKNHPNFFYHTIISKPQHHYQGDKGRVQMLVKKYITDIYSDFYLCGLWAMIEETRKLLLDMGVAKDSIYFERYD